MLLVCDSFSFCSCARSGKMSCSRRHRSLMMLCCSDMASITCCSWASSACSAFARLMLMMGWSIPFSRFCDVCFPPHTLFPHHHTLHRHYGYWIFSPIHTRVQKKSSVWRRRPRSVRLRHAVQRMRRTLEEALLKVEGVASATVDFDDAATITGESLQMRELSAAAILWGIACAL